MSARIIFEPWVAPDGQVQTFDDDVLAAGERFEFDAGWLHIVKGENATRLRSYPAHVINVAQHPASEARS